MSLLSVEDLHVEFASRGGGHPVLRGVNLKVAAGEVLGLVGESGSGKSVTSLAIMGLLPHRQARVTAGRIVLDGRDLRELSPRQLEDIRGSQVAMVFQEPMTSLNPALTVGYQIGEVVRRHRGATRAEARRRATELLDRVGLPDPARQVRRYPHELSGGMRQRVAIAMALAAGPRLLIADEPTTALDVTIQAQILDLLRELCAESGLAMIFVTHDLGVVAELCHRVAVMYAGEIVEEQDGASLFERPRHPYTAGLLASSTLGRDEHGRLWAIPGSPPLRSAALSGCRFAPRCAYAAPECSAPVEATIVHSDPSRPALVRCVRANDLDLAVTR